MGAGKSASVSAAGIEVVDIYKDEAQFLTSLLLVCSGYNRDVTEMTMEWMIKQKMKLNFLEFMGIYQFIQLRTTMEEQDADSMDFFDAWLNAFTEAKHGKVVVMEMAYNFMSADIHNRRDLDVLSFIVMRTFITIGQRRPQDPTLLANMYSGAMGLQTRPWSRTLVMQVHDTRVPSGDLVISAERLYEYGTSAHMCVGEDPDNVNPAQSDKCFQHVWNQISLEASDSVSISAVVAFIDVRRRLMKEYGHDPISTTTGTWADATKISLHFKPEAQFNLVEGVDIIPRPAPDDPKAEPGITPRMYISAAEFRLASIRGFMAKWRATCFMHTGHACLQLDGDGASKFKRLYFTDDQSPPVHIWEHNNQFPEEYDLRLVDTAYKLNCKFISFLDFFSHHVANKKATNLFRTFATMTEKPPYPIRYMMNFGIDDFTALSYMVYAGPVIPGLDKAGAAANAKRTGGNAAARAETDWMHERLLSKDRFYKIMREELAPFVDAGDEDTFGRLFTSLDSRHWSEIDWRTWRAGCRYNFFVKRFWFNQFPRLTSSKSTISETVSEEINLDAEEECDKCIDKQQLECLLNNVGKGRGEIEGKMVELFDRTEGLRGQHMSALGEQLEGAAGTLWEQAMEKCSFSMQKFVEQCVGEASCSEERLQKFKGVQGNTTEEGGNEQQNGEEDLGKVPPDPDDLSNSTKDGAEGGKDEGPPSSGGDGADGESEEDRRAEAEADGDEEALVDRSRNWSSFLEMGDNSSNYLDSKTFKNLVTDSGLRECESHCDENGQCLTFDDYFRMADFNEDGTLTLKEWMVIADFLRVTETLDDGSKSAEEGAKMASAVKCTPVVQESPVSGCKGQKSICHVDLTEDAFSQMSAPAGAGREGGGMKPYYELAGKTGTVDFRSWYIWADFWRLDTDYGGAVEKDEYETEVESLGTSDEKNGMKHCMVSTTPWNVLAPDADGATLYFYRYMAAWDFKILTLRQEQANMRPPYDCKTSFKETIEKEDIFGREQFRRPPRTAQLFLLYDVSEDRTWDLQEMMVFGLWRHINALSGRMASRVKEDVEVGVKDPSIGDFFFIHNGEPILYWSEPNGEAGVLKELPVKSISFWVGWIDYDRTSRMSPLKLVTMFFLLRYGQEDKNWALDHDQFAAVMAKSKPMVEQQQQQEETAAISPLSTRADILFNVFKAPLWDRLLGPDSFAVYHMFYMLSERFGDEDPRAAARDESSQVDFVQRKPLPAMAVVGDPGKSKWTVPESLTFQDWVGAWWYVTLMTPEGKLEDLMNYDEVLPKYIDKPLHWKHFVRIFNEELELTKDVAMLEWPALPDRIFPESKFLDLDGDAVQQVAVCSRVMFNTRHALFRVLDPDGDNYVTLKARLEEVDEGPQTTQLYYGQFTKVLFDVFYEPVQEPEESDQRTDVQKAPKNPDEKEAKFKRYVDALLMNALTFENHCEESFDPERNPACIAQREFREVDILKAVNMKKADSCKGELTPTMEQAGELLKLLFLILFASRKDLTDLQGKLPDPVTITWPNFKMLSRWMALGPPNGHLGTMNGQQWHEFKDSPIANFVLRGRQLDSDKVHKGHAGNFWFDYCPRTEDQAQCVDKCYDETPTKGDEKNEPPKGFKNNACPTFAEWAAYLRLVHPDKHWLQNMAMQGLEILTVHALLKVMELESGQGRHHEPTSVEMPEEPGKRHIMSVACYAGMDVFAGKHGTGVHRTGKICVDPQKRQCTVLEVCVDWDAGDPPVSCTPIEEVGTDTEDGPKACRTPQTQAEEEGRQQMEFSDNCKRELKMLQPFKEKITTQVNLLGNCLEACAECPDEMKDAERYDPLMEELNIQAPEQYERTDDKGKPATKDFVLCSRTPPPTGQPPFCNSACSDPELTKQNTDEIETIPEVCNFCVCCEQQKPKDLPGDPCLACKPEDHWMSQKCREKVLAGETYIGGDRPIDLPEEQGPLQTGEGAATQAAGQTEGEEGDEPLSAPPDNEEEGEEPLSARPGEADTLAGDDE
jgi:hypothetical protein